jgi:hypothetical protein
MELQPPDRVKTWFGRGMHFIQRVLDGLFYPSQDWFSRLVAGLFLIGLLVYGIKLWGIFYSWGNISFDFLDWAEVTGPRYALLKDAAIRGILPLHAGNLTALRGVTNRYFSIADTPFSPQYLLLRYLDTGPYLFYDTLLFYVLGFVGLVLLYRKYRLSPFAFGLLFLLFNFNGFVTAHFAVGHSIWTAYFLIPYIILLVLHLVENQKAGWAWVLAFSAVQLAILLQGFFHLYLWVLMFLAVLVIFNWRLIRHVFLGGLFSGLIALPRLLPPVLALSGITQEYKGGFASVTDLISGMIMLQDPQHAIRPLTDTFPLNAWEVDFYIGLLGLAFLVLFGVIVPLLRDRSRNSTQVQMLVPALVLAVFSIGQVFARVVSILRIPPFTGERVSSRMFILPMIVALVLAVIYLQRELNGRRPAAWVQVGALGLAYLLFHDLNQHMQAWRIRYLDSMVNLFPKMPFDPAQHTIQNQPDTIYLGLLAGGLVVALFALAFLLVMVIRERKPG